MSLLHSAFLLALLQLCQGARQMSIHTFQKSTGPLGYTSKFWHNKQLCTFCMTHTKTLVMFQLQPKSKKPCQAETQSNITARVAAWMKVSSLKLFCFQTQSFTDGRTENKNKRAWFLVNSVLLMLF